MPAVKWRPVEEITSALASPESDSSFTTAGSSDQNSGIIEFLASGRESCKWATPSSSAISKQA